MANPGFLISLNDLMPDSNRFIALLTQQHDLRDMERGLPLQNPSSPLLPMRTRVSLNKIDLFNDHFLFFGKDLQHPAALPPFFALPDHDQVILLDM